MATVVQRSAIGLCLIAVFVGLLAADRATGHGYGVIVLVTLLVAGALREYTVMLTELAHVSRLLLPAGADTKGVLIHGVVNCGSRVSQSLCLGVIA